MTFLTAWGIHTQSLKISSIERLAIFAKEPSESLRVHQSQGKGVMEKKREGWWRGRVLRGRRDVEVIPQLKALLLLSDANKDRSSSTKLENVDALISDVEDLFKTFSSFDVRPPDTDKWSCIGQEGTPKDLWSWAKSFGLSQSPAYPKVQEEFLAQSATLLSNDSLPLYLQITLFSFRRNLSEETSAFLQASLTQKMFVFNTIASK